MDQTNNEETKETPPESESGWAELTHDCLTNIIHCLSFEHRWRAMLVCKSWLLACKDPHLNTAFVLEHSYAAGRKIDSRLRSVAEWSQGSLREIRTSNCSNASLSFVANRCPNLEVLSIKSSPKVTNASMADIAFRCPMINELDISYCYGISHQSLLFIGRSCPNLTILKRNGISFSYLLACPQEADAIGISMPNLKHLELRFSRVTAKGLVLISGGCLKLEYLDVYGSAYLTSDDIDNATSGLKNLKEIKRSYLVYNELCYNDGYVPGRWF